MKKERSIRAFLTKVLHNPVKMSAPVFAAVLAVVLATGLVAGSAAVNVKQVMAYENYSIAFTLDGVPKTPTNEKGERVYPLSYNGSTFVPIRAVANMLGVPVEWDQDNYTVVLGNTSGDYDLIDNLKAYYLSSATQYQTTDKKTMDISGISCSHWIHLRLGGLASKGDLADASFNLAGKYNTLTFQYYSTVDTTLRVLGDNGYVLLETEVTGGQVAQTVTVNLHNTIQLTFQTEKTGSNFDAYVFNATLE